MIVRSNGTYGYCFKSKLEVAISSSCLVYATMYQDVIAVNTVLIVDSVSVAS
ncbi:hypothetical protein [Bacillus sp. JJ722]|uniref:hypothetical protein n=1 Tax=Bacillus sp. JJ722 TaxID=3122973 RepID=UPI0030007F0B